MKEKKYKLILNEKQMRVLKDVCELRFRIDLLQDSELAEILANIDCLKLDPRDPDYHKNFDSYIERREHLSVIIKALFEIASPIATRMSLGRKRDPDSLIAEDIFLVIRHQFYKEDPKKHEYGFTVDSYPPLCVSDQPLPKIEVSMDEK